MRTWGKGHAKDVLKLLAAHSVQVNDTARQRILACMDVALLDRWFDSALGATRLSDVFGDEGQ